MAKTLKYDEVEAQNEEKNNALTTPTATTENAEQLHHEEKEIPLTAPTNDDADVGAAQSKGSEDESKPMDMGQPLYLIAGGQESKEETPASIPLFELAEWAHVAGESDDERDTESDERSDHGEETGETEETRHATLHVEEPDWMKMERERAGETAGEDVEGQLGQMRVGSGIMVSSVVPTDPGERKRKREMEEDDGEQANKRKA